MTKSHLSPQKAIFSVHSLGLRKLRELSTLSFILSITAFTQANTLTATGTFVLPTPTLPPALPQIENLNLSKTCVKFYGQKPFQSSFIRSFENNYPLGKATPDYTKKTQVHGISYHSRGMESSDHCVQKDRLETIRNFAEAALKKYPKITPQQILAYRLHSESMVTTPNAFGDAIDRCFDSIKTKWLQCGGKYAQTAHYMEKIKAQLKVQVMPAYFYLSNSTGGPLWAAGMASIDKRTIFAIVPHLHSTGYIRSFESLVCWEFGNTFALNMGHFPQSISQEIGHQSPCNR